MEILKIINFLEYKLHNNLFVFLYVKDFCLTSIKFNEVMNPRSEPGEGLENRSKYNKHRLGTFLPHRLSDIYNPFVEKGIKFPVADEEW